MLKRLKNTWKWICSFALISSAIVSVAHEQHYAREKYQAKSQADCVALSISIGEKHACAKEAQSRKDYAQWWDVLVTWPEGITTWAIIATGFAIAWQSSETRKAAKATLLNAQTVINAECAWMLPRITQPPDYREIISPSENGNEPTLQIRLNITNYGKTPAIAIRALYGYSSEKIADPNAESWVLELPPIPSYENMHGGYVVPQAPGSSYVFKEGPRLRTTIDKAFLLKESPAWVRKERCLCVRGFYEYRDIFGQVRITRFCYAYQDVSQIDSLDTSNISKSTIFYRFRKAGPDVYNQITEAYRK